MSSSPNIAQKTFQRCFSLYFVFLLLRVLHPIVFISLKSLQAVMPANTHRLKCVLLEFSLLAGVGGCWSHSTASPQPLHSQSTASLQPRCSTHPPHASLTSPSDRAILTMLSALSTAATVPLMVSLAGPLLLFRLTRATYAPLFLRIA